MCGICGIVRPDGVRPEEIRRMLAPIAHRGPDGEGVYVNGAAGIGHRRLSIIDLPGGKQPICNEDGTIWIVCNGEIYNFRQLRERLEKKGHIFRTRSDTEAILHLYEDLGEGCVASLRGMFAFAVWDELRQKIFLARDRLGQKPLYYSRHGQSFFFASEVKGILAVTPGEREMDLLSAHYYLSLRFVPPPRTMLRHINKLPPAHTLVFQNGRLSTSRYWQLSFRKKLDLDPEDMLEALREKLEETVESHLVSDVPIGAFLSGGLDSAMIVAVMSGHLKQAPRTFSIGVQEDDFNELPYARMVAERYRTNHIEETVAANLIRCLPEIIRQMDEPSDPIAACMFYAARLASRHVKVVLGGDGGDELFAGFDRYAALRYIDAYRHVPARLRKKIIGPILDRFPDSFTYKSTTQKLRWVHRLALMPTAAEQFAEATGFFRFNQHDKRQLYADRLWKQLGGIDASLAIVDAFNGADAEDILDRMLFADYATRLPEHSLMLTDRMTMAHGLEARSPFLDHELVEFLAMVPGRLKIQRGRTKYLMRKLAADDLPAAIVHRRKQGFMFPIAYWFRTQLHPLICKTLTDSYFVREGLFSGQTVDRLLREHRNRRVDHHVRIWMLLSLEIWHRMYIEQVDPGAIGEKIMDNRSGVQDWSGIESAPFVRPFESPLRGVRVSVRGISSFPPCPIPPLPPSGGTQNPVHIIA